MFKTVFDIKYESKCERRDCHEFCKMGTDMYFLREKVWRWYDKVGKFWGTNNESTEAFRQMSVKPRWQP